jgi:hypothetical protein
MIEMFKMKINGSRNNAEWDYHPVTDQPRHEIPLVSDKFGVIEWIVACDPPPRQAVPFTSKQPMNMGLVTAAKKGKESLVEYRQSCAKSICQALHKPFLIWKNFMSLAVHWGVFFK